MAKNHIIVGLDIGTAFIKAAAAAKKPGTKDFEVLGYFSLPSFGLRRGVVVRVDEVSKIVQQVLLRLQEDVGISIDDVYINVGGSHIFSTPSHGTVIVSRADQRISEEDMDRVIQAAQAFSLPSNREILDIFPREFIVDGQGQIKEPLEMRGLRLEAEVLALCAFSPYLKNLTSAVLTAGFQISDIVPSCLASARAILSPQQKELGVCLLDIGGGTTDMAVYEEGDLIHLAVFPMGSERITNDLAIGLKTDVEIAEQIKKEFGTCLLKGSNKKEKIELPPQGSGEKESLVFSHKMLVDIIEARVSEIFGLVRKELKQIAPKSMLPAGIVLTGGGAKLPKIADIAKKELKLPIRIGRTYGIMAGALNDDSAWSVALGLVLGGSDLLQENGAAGSNLFNRTTVNKLKRIFKIFIP